MIKSYFSYLSDFIEENQIPNLKKHLKKLGLYDDFKELENDFGEDWDKIATFIIFCYSTDSTYIISNADWKQTKISIFEMVGLDIDKHGDALNFKIQSVKDAARKVGEILNDWRYWQLVVWKETTILLDQLATTKPSADQKSPAKNVADATKFSEALKRKIADLEKEILQTAKSPERHLEAKELQDDEMTYEKLLKQHSKN